MVGKEALNIKIPLVTLNLDKVQDIVVAVTCNLERVLKDNVAKLDVSIRKFIY